MGTLRNKPQHELNALRLRVAELEQDREGARAKIAALEKIITTITAPGKTELPQTDVLKRQLLYEKCAASSISILAQSGDFDSRLSSVLDTLQTVVQADRAYVFRHHVDPQRGAYMSQINESCAAGITPQLNNPELQCLPYESAMNLLPRLLAKEPYSHIVAEMPSAERAILESQQIVSILIVPIYSQDTLWGFIGFDDCETPRRWHRDDIYVLQSIADAIGATAGRWQTERRLSEERAQLLSIFDSIDEVIYVVDFETYEILFVNKTLQKDFSQDIVGGLCYKALQGLDQPCEFCTNEIIKAIDPKPYVWEHFNQRVGRHFALVDRIINWPDGRRVRFELAKDITQQKQAEADKERLFEQLRQSQKMEAIGRLAGGIAHDFNNILTGINGYAELALNELTPTDPLRGDLETIHTAGKRAADLTSQLLTFSRKQIITPRLLDANAALKNSKKILERTIGEDIELTFIGAQEKVCIKADPNQLDQILMNLAVNARDAMQSGGRLTIQLQQACIKPPRRALTNIPPGDYVLLQVTDNGVGMDEVTCSKIFEPFFTTKPQGQGTGLGLAMVYGIVRQNQGFIEVSSKPGKGTTFSLYFPQVQETEKELLVTRRPAVLLTGKETILIVEDEAIVLELASKILAGQGYRTLTAKSGEEALLRSRDFDQTIDLLLADVILQGINGHQLYQKLQSTRPQLRVLFMSGYTDQVISQHGVLEPGVSFLQKPFSIETITTAVRNVLDS